ncbi:unnamed protein product [Phyllotreta striolata]|uniref:Major facilitator superfamily (MFS) profile domain-containing protein n=1 Tax=Phyllotreta striolata TaxID=444603 RepID=A0A9N9TRZ7_PHYSR|nr:unnamed protein product [Phyllotreta striolata]
MDRNNIIFRLQIITLLDSICYGLIYIFLAPYLLVLGGNAITIGIFGSVTMVFQVMSILIVKEMLQQSGLKETLVDMFIIAAITHTMLFVTKSPCGAIMIRCLFASVNQTTNVIKEIFVKYLPQDRREYHMNIYNTLYSAGFVIGPILSGALFEISFTYSCLLAAILTIVNIWLIVTIPIEEDIVSTPVDVSMVKKIRQTVEHRLTEFRQPITKENWDILAVQFLFTANVIFVTTKFAPVTSHNYQHSHSDLGVICAYMNILIFVALHFSPAIMEKLDRHSPATVVKAMFGVILVSAVLSFFSPYILLFCAMYVPLTFARIVLNESWKAVHHERGGSRLDGICESVNFASGFAVPLAFGVGEFYFGHLVTIYSTIVSLVLAMLVVQFVTISKSQSGRSSSAGHDSSVPKESCPACYDTCGNPCCQPLSFCPKTKENKSC